MGTSTSTTDRLLPLAPREWLLVAPAREKVRGIQQVVDDLLKIPASQVDRVAIPPGRDVSVCDIKLHPVKPGIATLDGQGRLLHDLGNIELQAMELAVRTLIEFPEAPPAFREELGEIAIDEARHFGLCLDALEELERPWGSWPVHRSLWDAVGEEPLLERVLIVHRHMEGSGLDAGARMYEKLLGVGTPESKITREVVGTIMNEEIGHVSFGSKWYRQICAANGVDAEAHFREFYPRVLRAVPRTEKPAYDLRRQAGFSEVEIAFMTEVRAATDYTKPRLLPTDRELGI